MSEDKIVNVSPEKQTKDKAKADALNHLVQGKRHLLVQDIPSAVDSLQEACKLLAQEFGEFSDECGEAYYYYGKALLELARDENMFGAEKLKANDDDDEDDVQEDDDNAENEKEDSGNDGENEENSGEEEEDRSNGENGDDKRMEQECDEQATDLSSTSEGVSNREPQPGTSSGETKPDEEPKKEEEEEVTNLQIAWEMLELAKVVYTRQAGDGVHRLSRIAEIHLALGEVAMESEMFPQAVEEIERCLAMQENILSADDRNLAHTHYQLGLALTFTNNFDDAIRHLHSALGIMKIKLTNLKNQLATEEANDNAEESTSTLQREISDLLEIIPDIESKIIDTEESKRILEEKIAQEALKAAGLLLENNSDNQFTAEVTKKSDKPVLSISHLVKRKRNPEDEPSNEVPDKKPRVPGERTNIFTGGQSSASETSNSFSLKPSSEATKTIVDSGVSSTAVCPSKPQEMKSEQPDVKTDAAEATAATSTA